MKRLPVYLTEGLYEWVRRTAYERHQTLSQVVADAVAQYRQAQAGGADPAAGPGEATDR